MLEIWRVGIRSHAAVFEKKRSDSPKVNPYRGPSDVKPFDEKLAKDEVEAFYDALRDRDRTIVLSAIAENHLTSLLPITHASRKGDLSAAIQS
jgi:hypothetical protein